MLRYILSMCTGRRIGRLDHLWKIVLALQVVALGAGMWAQQRPTISSRVNVVTLFATVHDADGRVVKNLTPDDFVLLEDGERQDIEFFTKETDLPLTIGLLVDTSRSQTGVLEEERRASYVFLDQVLREGKDQAFVVHFDMQVETAQVPTSSRSQLEAALSQLKIPPRDTTLIYSAIKNSSEDWRCRIWASFQQTRIFLEEMAAIAPYSRATRCGCTATRLLPRRTPKTKRCSAIPGRLQRTSMRKAESLDFRSSWILPEHPP